MPTPAPRDGDGSAAPPTTMGRRERKRLETRARLVHAALELFTEHGFDAVTVTDIAEKADVDPSTFFRHFGSKDAVLFADYDVYFGEVKTAMQRRPAGEPTAVALRETMKGLVDELLVDTGDEPLRLSLAASSPSLQAQTLVMRERLVNEMADALADHLEVDRSEDPVPTLFAALWMEAANWYRATAVAAGGPVLSAAEAVAEIDKVLRSVLPVLNEER